VNPFANALGEVRGYLAMTGVFVLGLIGGVWAVIAPFATGWPLAANGSWSHAMWAIVIPGIVLIVVSGAAIVLTTGLAARAAVRVRALAAEEPE
jgi:hypothetical protein